MAYPGNPRSNRKGGYKLVGMTGKALLLGSIEMPSAVLTNGLPGPWHTRLAGALRLSFLKLVFVFFFSAQENFY